MERIQHVFTRYIAGFLHLSYTQRLFVLGLGNLSVRVKNFKLITLYKIFRGLIDIDLVFLNLSIIVGRISAI